MTSENERAERGASEEMSGAPLTPAEEGTSKRPAGRPEESPGAGEPPPSTNEATLNHPDPDATHLEDASPDDFE
ncbi:hypothetical protein [Actinomadura sp. SCN-SB]|uniref:hypothetical protein n=1 Tax=Actinomadura sp. SCN-SB TaxID=3373092 RepID=UPI0037502634